MLQFFKAQPDGEKKQYPRIDKAGRYVAEVVKVEQIQNKEHPDWKPGTRFLFRVLEEPFVGSFASGIVTSEWKIGNALDSWCAALGINGAELTDIISEDIFKKRRAVIGIEINDRGYPNVKALYTLRDEDKARISPKANYNRPAASPAPQQAQPKAAAPIAQQPPVSNPGTITKDDSLPF